MRMLSCRPESASFYVVSSVDLTMYHGLSCAAVLGRLSFPSNSVDQFMFAFIKCYLVCFWLIGTWTHAASVHCISHQQNWLLQFHLNQCILAVFCLNYFCSTSCKLFNIFFSLVVRYFGNRFLLVLCMCLAGLLCLLSHSFYNMFIQVHVRVLAGL